MPAYLYCCPVHNEFEITHSIKEKLELCPKCQEEGNQTKINRLIAGASNFVLNGGCWGKDNYK